MTAWRKTPSSPTRSWVVCVLLVLLALSATQLFAQTPIDYRSKTVAGTSITNNATVNYTVGGVAQNPITSNDVTTVVQQIDSFYLELNNVVANNTKYAGVPGQTIDITYTIHNLSNGTIAVSPTLPTFTGGADANNTKLFANDGSALPATVTVAGATYTFHVKVTIPNGLTTAQADWGRYTVKLTDNPNALSMPANVDKPAAYETSPTYNVQQEQHQVQIDVVTLASMDLQKYFSTSPGIIATKVTHGAGGTFWVNLTYTNKGSMPSGDVTFTDTLPANWFVTGSAYFNATPVGASNTLAPTNLGNAGTGSFSISGTTITAKVTNVPASQGVVYYFAFQVAIPDIPNDYTNTAATVWADQATGGSTFNGSATGTYTVDPRYAIALTNVTPGTGIRYAGNPASPTLFLLNVQNSGNIADTVWISNSLGNFPAGTTFRFFSNGGTVANPAIGTELSLMGGSAQQPGASYLLGQIAAGASSQYVLAVQLPAGAADVSRTTTAAATGQAGAGTGSDKSNVDQTIQHYVEALDLLSAATNGVASKGGDGRNTTGVIVTGSTPASYPGLGSYAYTLFIHNYETQPESVTLTAADDSSKLGLANPLPANWTVDYFQSTGGNCSTLGSAIAGVISVDPATMDATSITAGEKIVCARVTIPYGTAVTLAPHAPVWFQANSAVNSAANDYLKDALQVTAFHYLTIDSNSHTVNAGSSYTYTAVITNYGNVNEPVGTSFFQTIGNSTGSNGSPAGPQLFTVNGSINPGAAAPYIIPGATSTSNNQLAVAATTTPGAPRVTNYYIYVAADNSDKPGDFVTTSVTFSYFDGTAQKAITGTYTTTVLNAFSNVLIQKLQALDAGCDGTADTPYGLAVVKAQPGQCVAYQITATNGTGTSIDSLSLTDRLDTAYVTYCASGVCGTVPPATWTLPGGVGETTDGSFTAPNLKSNTLTGLTSGVAVTWRFEVQVK